MSCACWFELLCLKYNSCICSLPERARACAYNILYVFIVLFVCAALCVRTKKKKKTPLFFCSKLPKSTPPKKRRLYYPNYLEWEDRRRISGMYTTAKPKKKAFVPGLRSSYCRSVGVCNFMCMCVNVWMLPLSLSSSLHVPTLTSPSNCPVFPALFLGQLARGPCVLHSWMKSLISSKVQSGLLICAQHQGLGVRYEINV